MRGFNHRSIWDMIEEDEKEIECLKEKFFEKPLIICCAGG